jgi:hypothetical protein
MHKKEKNKSMALNITHILTMTRQTLLPKPSQTELSPDRRRKVVPQNYTIKETTKPGKFSYEQA